MWIFKTQSLRMSLSADRHVAPPGGFREYCTHMASGLGLTPSLLGTGDGGADPSGQGLAPCRESLCPGNWASCSGIQPQHRLHTLMLSLCQAPGGLWEDRASVTGSSHSHGAAQGEGHHGDSEKSSGIGYLER